MRPCRASERLLAARESCLRPLARSAFVLSSYGPVLSMPVNSWDSGSHTSPGTKSAAICDSARLYWQAEATTGGACLGQSGRRQFPAAVGTAVQLSTRKWSFRMTDVTPIGFPAISKVLIGDYVVETVDARAVHRALKVGRDFPNWIRDRVEGYNFLENQDFRIFANSGEKSGPSRQTLDYAITLDMAKELAMVECSELGRSVRRYFIDCERQARSQLAPLSDEAAQAVIDDKVSKALAIALPQAIKHYLGNKLTAIRYGKTSGQIWRVRGYPPIRITRWFSNKLVLAGCEIEGGGRGELGLMRAKLFDPDKAEQWLRNGGDLLVKRKILERQGPGRLHLVHARPFTV